MHSFRSILVILGEQPASASVLDRARWIAGRTGASLALACQPAGHADVEEWLRGVPGAGQELAVLPEPGHAGIIREVMRGGHDLVMKAAVVEQGLLTHLRTSIDEHLLRECPAAVWLDRSGGMPAEAPVLAAVEPEPAGLAADVLAAAVGMAAIAQTRLIVVHAWELEGESGLRGRALTQQAEAEVDGLVAEARAARAAELEALLTPHLGGPMVPELRLEKGQPDIVIPQLAAELGAGLLVMGSLARRGLAGLVMGNTAEDVLPLTGCTLLALKPAGFVSPIEPAG